jgi:Kef-type K+ transport system membrane component KefB
MRGGRIDRSMKHVRWYLLLVGLPLAGLLSVLHLGDDLGLGAPAPVQTSAAPAQVPHVLLILILQIAVVLAAARGVGWAFRRFGQPQVVGEMVAGILLGPSLLGWLAPDLFASVFPPGSVGLLGQVSQLGILLFMFLVGAELDPELLRRRSDTAVITSHVSIAAPLFMGAALSLFLYPRYSEGNMPFHVFALFMGAAMSVTAFPVLARILTERNLLRTRLGAVTIACAAVDDVTAWCILAGVIALIRADGSLSSLGITLAGTGAYVAAMLLLVRPALRRLERYYHARGFLTQDVLAGIFMLLLASAYTTEWLGIHALFGAFLAGAILPREGGLVRELSEKIQDVTVVFLLPIFFAATGLRTSIGLVSGFEAWATCGLIIAVAVAGKLGGSTLAARTTGLSWREAGAVGILMNTRGLVELVFLTIGFELGILSPTLFTMMVLMALVTTFMASPVLEWIYPTELIRSEAIGGDEEHKDYTVLIPIALPSAGPDLLRLAAALGSASQQRIYGLHLIPAWDRSVLGPEQRANLPSDIEMLRPMLNAAKWMGLTVRPLAIVSRDVGSDIVEVSNAKGADLVLMGWHKPLGSESIVSDTVRTVMTSARADVGVYVPRHFRPFTRVLVTCVGSRHDRAALAIAQRLAEFGSAEVTLLRAPHAADHATETESTEGRFALIEAADPLGDAVQEAKRGYDLVIAGISDDAGPALFGSRHERLALECPASLLIVRSSSA